MNIHFFIDEKFVDDFILDAESVSNENIFVYTFKSPSKFVTSLKGIFAPYESNTMHDLLNNITSFDKVFIHWYHRPVQKIINSIPKDTNVYLCFWGGDFLQVPLSCGFKNKLTTSILEPKSLAIYKEECRFYFKQRLQKISSNYTIQGSKIKRLFVAWNLFKQYYNAIPQRNYNKVFKERQRFLQRLSGVCHWNHLDINLLESHYQVQLKQYPFFYSVGNLERSKKINESSELRIWLGNSDTISNNHLEAFDLLLKFKQESIKIYCPLNYGNKKYSNLVAEKGKELFGEKFIALQEYMPRDSYYQLLDTMDICFMNHVRSQAAGNIFAFIQKRKKVILNSKSSIFKLFGELNIKVNSDLDIVTCSFEELKRPLNNSVIDVNIQILHDKLYNTSLRLNNLKNLLAPKQSA